MKIKITVSVGLVGCRRSRIVEVDGANDADRTVAKRWLASKGMRP